MLGKTENSRRRYWMIYVGIAEGISQAKLVEMERSKEELVVMARSFPGVTEVVGAFAWGGVDTIRRDATARLGLKVLAATPSGEEDVGLVMLSWVTLDGCEHPGVLCSGFVREGTDALWVRVEH